MLAIIEPSVAVEAQGWGRCLPYKPTGQIKHHLGTLGTRNRFPSQHHTYNRKLSLAVRVTVMDALLSSLTHTHTHPHTHTHTHTPSLAKQKCGMYLETLCWTSFRGMMSTRHFLECSPRTQYAKKSYIVKPQCRIGALCLAPRSSSQQSYNTSPETAEALGR